MKRAVRAGYAVRLNRQAETGFPDRKTAHGFNVRNGRGIEKGGIRVEVKPDWLACKVLCLTKRVVRRRERARGKLIDVSHILQVLRSQLPRP